MHVKPINHILSPSSPSFPLPIPQILPPPTVLNNWHGMHLVISALARLRQEDNRECQASLGNTVRLNKKQNNKGYY
jgi:hypothetical protein